MSVLSNDRIQGPLSTVLCRFESDMVLAQEFDRSGDEEREGRKERHRGQRVRRRAEKGRDGKRKIRPVILGSDIELVLGICEQGRLEGDSAH